MILSKEEQEEYYEDGFVVIGFNRLFSESEISAIRAKCDEIIPDWNEGFGSEIETKSA